MSWQAITTLDDIPLLGSRVLTHPDGDIALFRPHENQVFALRDRCPHKGGPLSQGLLVGESVVCPLHSWHIDLRSGIALPPDQGCAGHIPCKVEDGRVWLDLT